MPPRGNTVRCCYSILLVYDTTFILCYYDSMPPRGNTVRSSINTAGLDHASQRTISRHAKPPTRPQAMLPVVTPLAPRFSLIAAALHFPLHVRYSVDAAANHVDYVPRRASHPPPAQPPAVAPRPPIFHSRRRCTTRSTRRPTPSTARHAARACRRHLRRRGKAR